MMIKEAIIALSKRCDLSCETVRAVMDEIMTGAASPVQMSAYLTALSLKGETVDEITASAEGMRSHCVQLSHDLDVLEIVGTGGDHSNTFNISTAAALIVAACGIPVAKHGNRSASSKCGSADVLEAVGVKIDIPPEKSKAMLEECGFCFMYAPTYHPAMKHVAPIRRELGIRTVFNILGPMTNPANAKTMLLGVYSRDLVEPIAQVLVNLGVEYAVVAYGENGIDEISLSAPTFIARVSGGVVQTDTITPEKFGFKRCNKADLTGGDVAENARILKSVLSVQDENAPITAHRAKRDAAVLNAAMAMGASLLWNGSYEEAITKANKAIDSGAALRKLEEIVRFSHS
jgi:anthranilate phosphoribosyltransferase